jgi:osmotically-inducible protein OsmY
MSTVHVYCPGLPSPRLRGGITAVGCRLVRAAALVWAVVGASPGPALAGDPLRRDLRLTFLALDTLQRDPVLAPWELEVHVHNGVASLRGEVPSKEVAERAVARLKQLPQLGGVRNQLTLVPLPSVPVPQGAGPRPPSQRDGDSGTKWPPQGVVQAPARQSPPPPRGKPTPVPVSPTSSGAPAPVFPARTPSGIESAVRRRQLQDERFRRLRVEVQGDRVYLSGAVATWRDLHDFSEAITRIPGVAGVTVREIRTDPPRR